MKEIEVYKHIVQYYETDMMGVAHHANYLHWMEEARIDFMDRIGFPYTRMEAGGVVSPVVSIECKYKSPTTFKDIIEVEVCISGMSELKFEFFYTMRKEGKLVAEGHSVHCFTENGRPVIIERRLPELYERIKKSM